MSVLLTLGFVTDSVYAQDRVPLVVAPARMQLNVNPGENYNLSVKFINEAQQPVSGIIKVVDFIVTNDNGFPTLLDNLTYPLSNQYSASSWITLPYEKATIAAQDIVRVNFKVKVPEDAKSGGHYAAVYFETSGLDQLGSGSTDQFSATSSRVVSLISFRVAGDVTESALISGLSIPQFLQFGPVPVTFEIFNKGDYHINPKGQITITNWFGSEIDRETIETRNIFPDAKRNFEAKLGKTWMFGKYKVDIAASYGEAGKVAKASQVVWVIPVVVIIIFILSITIIIMLGMYISRKLTGRQKTLERKLEMEISELESLKNKFKDKIAK
ncbi:MAG: hypothetical protein UX28_C0008G0002 [Candidatus Pacebacteria bacterium GW2011_GWA1_46_10]|nr:MAG: hypothetical protein UX28_C0008G0002 [Candidatus Pacebacteria bacterium GW2011_GWA1_46_10]